jgi:tripartite-type tricarboxylate transporter receptor subunit TctC
LLPDVKQNLTHLGVDIVGNTPEQFAAVIRNDAEKWMRLANTKTLIIK